MNAIDTKHIESLGGFGYPELIEILQDFLAGLDAHSAQLASLLEIGDRDAFRESAHRLKGGAQMSGFPEIGGLAANWEDLARNGSPLPEKAELVAQLSTAITAAKAAFQNALTS